MTAILYILSAAAAAAIGTSALAIVSYGAKKAIQKKETKTIVRMVEKIEPIGDGKVALTLKDPDDQLEIKTFNVEGSILDAPLGAWVSICFDVNTKTIKHIARR